MKLRLVVAIALLVVATTTSAGELGKAKDALAREFKGQKLRLRMDVREDLPTPDGATTASADGVSYPANFDKPVVFTALSTVEIESFWFFKGREGVTILLKRPGYKLFTAADAFASLAAPSPAHDVELQRKRDQASAENMCSVILRGATHEELRAAMGRILYLDGATPSDDDYRRCIRRREGEEVEITASRCSLTVERVQELTAATASTP